MKRHDLPEAFKALPNCIQGAGIEVCLLDSRFKNEIVPTLKLHAYTLMVVLDGPIIVACNGHRETLGTSEAIMMKKNCKVGFELPRDSRSSFRCLFIFFDESSLKYALMPFELPSSSSDKSFFKIPLNDKIQIFTDSILLFYESFQIEQNWSLLLQSKLRELIWIFFHTEIKDEAMSFFAAGQDR